jgi:hypothetical protein
MQMSGSEYRKRQDGGTTVFEVIPAPQKKFMYVVLGGGLLVLMGLSFFSSAHLLSLLGIAGGGVAIWWGWTHDLRPVSHRSVSTFSVTADAIQSNGQTFGKNDIHRLIVKNGLTDEEVGIPGVLIEVPRAQAMGAAFRAEVSRSAHGLEVESGGRGYVLAGGMDKTTAFGLLTDVSRALGFSAH